jgi:hypothetical protein
MSISEVLSIAFLLLITSPFWFMFLYPIYKEPIRGLIFVAGLLLTVTVVHAVGGLALGLPLYLLGYHPSEFSEPSVPRRY